MIKVGIASGAGYTAGELIRILVNHPDVKLCAVQSESHAGDKICEVHDGLIGDCDLHFTDNMDLSAIDVLFMCGAHGASADYLASHKCPDTLKIIDLAQDFRDESKGYVYGLPEWQKDKIAKAGKVANPGCFATAIQLALLPLAEAGELKNSVNVTAITGSTGAGVKPSQTSHFSWRNNNLSTYKVFEHQHLIEIKRNLAIAGANNPEIDFIPVRGDFARGIFATLTTESSLSLEQAAKLYADYYAQSAFTHFWNDPLDLKKVVNTNKCLVTLEKHGDKLVITSVLDNLLKGASGQAVQNMNIMFGLPENQGLKLKASAF